LNRGIEGSAPRAPISAIRRLLRTVHGSVEDGDAESEASLTPGTDHDRPTDLLAEDKFDVGIRPARTVRAIHFSRRQVDSAMYERMAIRAKGDRLR